MKYLSTIFSILIYGLKLISNENMKKFEMETSFLLVRKAAMVVMINLFAINLLVAGVLIMILNGAMFYEHNGFFSPTLTFYCGLVLTLISGLIVALGMRKQVWCPITNTERDLMAHDGPSNHNSSLEQALSLLIVDMIEERKIKRARSTSENPSPVANPCAMPS